MSTDPAQAADDSAPQTSLSDPSSSDRSARQQDDGGGGGGGGHKVTQAALLTQSLAFGVILGVQGVVWTEVLIRLALSDGVFGSAQLALPLVGMVVLALNAKIYSALGAKNQSLLALALLLAGMVTIGLVQNLVGLILGLLLCGLGFASLDAATSAAAIDLEKATGKHFLSFMHGVQAASVVLGALIAGGALAAGWAYPQVMIVVSLAVCVPVGLFTAVVPFVKSAGLVDEEQIPSSLWKNKQFVTLVAVCFAGSAAEAIAVVWSVIYLREEGMSIGVAGVLFAAFNGAMILARFGNGWLIRSKGVRASLWLSGVGILVAGVLLLTAGNLALAGLGLVVLGLAVAGIQPSTISAAGSLGENSGAAASGVMLAAYFALLAAPFLYGWLAELSSLQVAMILVALCGVASSLLVFSLASGRGQTAPEPA
ncbi:MFS transporter [Saccharothrix stipae]